MTVASKVDDGDTEERNSTLETTDKDTPSIDKGWAWVVCFGALIINIIYDGCSYSFGIFFTNFLTYFGDTRSNTAWIGSLFFSVPLLCGPIAAHTTSRIGFRKATIAGGFIAAVGFICGVFSNSVTTLCVTYGLISGFGMSLPYFNSIMVEAVYFRKRRALATGIAESGAGVGTVIFAPLTNYLISVYGWRGALLIIGGIVANIIVCGAVFRPVQSKDKKSLAENADDAQSLSEGNKNALEMYETNIGAVANNPSNMNTSNYLTATEHHNSNSKINTLKLNKAPVKYDCAAEEETLLELEINGVASNDKASNDNTHKSRSLLELKDEVGKDLTGLKSKQSGIIRIISRYVAHTDILTNRGFILFSISNFVMYFWYDVPYVFLVDRAISMNISDTNATFLISIIGIVHTVGNIGYGFLGDKEKISKTFLYGVSIILCGFSLTLVPLFTEYPPLAILAGLFGLFSAANEAMCSIILIQVVGLQNLNQSYGVIMMLQGIANLVGPPVAGWLCDVTGTYNVTFYTAGTCVMAAGLVYLLLPVLQKTENGYLLHKSGNCSKNQEIKPTNASCDYFLWTYFPFNFTQKN